MPRDGGQDFAELENWLAQHSREVIIVCNPDGVIISASPASASVLGFTPDALRGMSLFDFILSEQVADLRQSMHDPTAAAYRLQHPARHQSGRVMWLETTAESIGDENGQIVRLVALMRDITPRRRLELQLRENRIRLRLINTIALKIVSGASLEHIIHFSLEQIHGQFPQLRIAYLTLNADGIITVQRGLAPPHMPEVVGIQVDLKPWPAYLKPLQAGEPLIVEDVSRETKLNGLLEVLQTTRTQAFLAVPIVVEGQIAGHLCLSAAEPHNWSAHEIALLSEIGQYLAVAIREARVQAERQEAQESLRLAVERFRTVLKNSPITVFNQDTDLRYTWIYNPVLNLPDVIGKHDSDLFENAEEAQRVMALKRRVLETGRGMRQEITYKIQGETFWFDITIEPLRDEQSEIIGITCATTDITDRKVMEDKALQLTVEQERVRVITRFIRDASHEFRTPLSIIGSSLYLMQRSEDAERRQYHVQKARDQIDRIVQLLEDLSLMASLDTGVPLTVHPADANRLVREVVTQFQPRFDRAQLRLEMSLDDTLPTIRADTERLRIALTKLVDNAIRYTPASGVITIATQDESDQIAITVTDTGGGIDEAAQARVFERFFRQDEARVKPGFGLGLPIARKIIEMHGGGLSMISFPAQGSIFTIRLPVSTFDAAARSR